MTKYIQKSKFSYIYIYIYIYIDIYFPSFSEESNGNVGTKKDYRSR